MAPALRQELRYEAGDESVLASLSPWLPAFWSTPIVNTHRVRSSAWVMGRAAKPMHFPPDFRKAVIDRVRRTPDHQWCSYGDIIDFFAEIVDLENLPSFDSRYSNAAMDLQAHVVWNEDYELDELMTDSRFDPKLLTDEQFKRFVETGLRHDFQTRVSRVDGYQASLLDRSIDERPASSLADLLRPMFQSIGLDVVPKVEFGIEVGYQIVANRAEASNQGRAHSSNPAPLEYRGLHFRSKIEVEFFKAIFGAGYLVAPLPVFVHKPTQRRVEPDFVIVKYGIWAIIEIDGTAWHHERPVEAAKRLDPFTDEGVRIIRFADDELASPEGLTKALDEINRKFDNWQKSR